MSEIFDPQREPLSYTTKTEVPFALVPPVPQRPRLNPLAVLAVVLGVIGLGPAAVISGHVAVVQLRRAGERGRGLAIAGLVLGYVWTVAIALTWIAASAFLGSLRDGGYLPN